MDIRNMQRREIYKYIKQNCAPSWIYLQVNILNCKLRVVFFKLVTRKNDKLINPNNKTL